MATLSVAQIAARMAADSSTVAVQFLMSGETFVWGGLRYRVELVSGGRDGGLVPVLAWDNEGRSSLIEIPLDTMVKVLA